VVRHTHDAAKIHHDGEMVIAGILSGALNEMHKLPGPLVYVVVCALVFGEAALFIGFFLPAEVAVLVSGAIASQGHVSVVLLCILVVASAIAGDSVGYFVGEHWGHHLLKLPVVRKRQFLIHSALDGLRKRGPIYVFIGRFTAFLRAVMPGLAGMSKLQYRRFFIANATGGLIWGVGFTLLGYFAGTALTKVEKYASWAGIALVAVMICAFAGVQIFTRKREKTLEAAWRSEHPEGEPEPC
jgi:membrane-associated protein